MLALTGVSVAAPGSELWLFLPLTDCMYQINAALDTDNIIVDDQKVLCLICFTNVCYVNTNINISEESNTNFT